MYSKKKARIKSVPMLEVLERELTCQFCLGTLEDPRLLDCLHSFCKQCIVGMEIANAKSIFKCPQCQERFRIPDVEKLTADKVADAKKRDLKLLKQISDSTLTCSLCPVPRNAAKAIYICLDCRDDQQFLCHACSANHYTKPELSDHHLELVDHLSDTERCKSLTGRTNIFPRRQSLISNLCNIHGLQLRYFCEVCTTSICHDCKKELHSEHTINDMGNAVEKVQEILPTELLYVIGIRDGLQQSIKPMEENKRKIDDQREYLSDEISTRIGRVSTTLQHYEKELQTQLQSSADAKVNMLSTQIGSVTKLIDRADQLALMLSDVDRLSYQSDILSVTHMLLSKVEELKRDYNAAVRMSPGMNAVLRRQASLTPCEEANMGIIFNTDSLKKELTRECRIFSKRACPQFCYAAGPGLISPEALKLTYFHVYLRNEEDKPCVAQQHIQVFITINSLHVTTAETPTVLYKGSGAYMVNYCPKVGGSGTVRVLVNEADINDSPFGIHIKTPSPIAEKSRHFASIRGVTIPVGITQDISGNVLITNKTYSSKIVVISEDGHEITQIEDEQNRLRDPCGIATDSKGNIFVTSSFYHCVLKYSPNGMFLKSTGKIGRGKGEFQNPAGLHVTLDGKVFVCDTSNCRINVFNDELELLQEINLAECGIKQISHPSYPYDIAFNSSNHMFISDTMNNCILVFGSNGMFSSRICDVDKERGQLKQPKGIAIDNDGYLFVSDSGN